MTTELDALVVSLRADTRQFRADIAQAQSAMSDLEAMVTLPQDAMGQRLSQLADLSGAIDQSVRSSFSGLDQLLSRFVETGKLSFGDLRSVALSALNDIAQAALQSLFPGGGGGGGGFGGGGIFSSFLSGVVGLPGRAHGGPVTPNQPYMVGEQGPELFVPRTAGDIRPNRPASGPAAAGGSGRPISIVINVAGGGDGADARQQSATQIALSVRRALAQAQRFD